MNICSEASVRGTLNATEGLAGAAGTLVVFILANFTDWRTVSLCCLAIPIITMAAVCFIPESPMWYDTYFKLFLFEKNLEMMSYFGVQVTFTKS